MNTKNLPSHSDTITMPAHPAPAGLVSRRSIMNTLVKSSAIAASASVVALPVATEATPTAPFDIRQEIVGRAQRIVDVLDGAYVREGWHETFDRDRAAKFVEAVKSEVYAADNDPSQAFITDWMHDHGQSLDWLYRGACEAMIASVAERSPPAAGLPVSSDPIFAAIAAHREAWAKFVNEVHRLSKKEDILPTERREHYHITHRGTDVGKDDDPRWTAAQTEYWKASDRVDEIA
jgi:hypothetical protein